MKSNNVFSIFLSPGTRGHIYIILVTYEWTNGTARFKKCKQLFEYKHLLLLRHLVVQDLIYI